MEYTYCTKIVSAKNGSFNLKEAVTEIIKNGFAGANPKYITVFVNFEGLNEVVLVQERLEVIIDDKVYPLVIEETDEIHKHGDVRIKYNT